MHIVHFCVSVADRLVETAGADRMIIPTRGDRQRFERQPTSLRSAPRVRDRPFPIRMESWEQRGNNCARTPKTRDSRADQSAGRINNMDVQALSAKPPSPVQIRTAPPNSLKKRRSNGTDTQVPAGTIASRPRTPALTSSIVSIRRCGSSTTCGDTRCAGSVTGRSSRK
jgi:hypothetical protein